MYLQKGGVKFSVANESGKEAAVAMFGPQDFFGEGCMRARRRAWARLNAVAPRTILKIDRDEMLRVLHAEQAFSNDFINCMLTRNIRVEEDLIDQLFNSARSGWPGRCCCWRTMEARTGRTAFCRKFPRRRWRKWSARGDHASIFS
jgi:CRP-like cAMP-binding protein